MPAGTRCALLMVGLAWSAPLLVSHAPGQTPLGNSPAKTEASPQATADRVYMLRGWANVFSMGLDTMAEKLNGQGVSAQVWGHNQGRQVAAAILADKPARVKPLVLVGHSQGADDLLGLAQELSKQGITVDLLITMEAPIARAVPANVKRTVNFYRPKYVLGRVPLWRGVALTQENASAGALENINIRQRPDLNDGKTTHGTITDNSRIQQTIISEILAVWNPVKR